MAYTDAQFIVLGTGDRYYETQLWQMTARYPGRMSTQLLYNDALSRRMYAGCDTFLMPSRFEPCGISQMLSLRYGCVPMVRRTGGLVDTVSHHDPINNVGTGYCFDRYEPLDLFTCMIRTWEGFRYKDKWKELQQRGMNEDFSWDISAKKYVKLYSDVLGLPPEEPAPEAQAELIVGKS
jgi:starch synthase